MYEENCENTIEIILPKLYLQTRAKHVTQRNDYKTAIHSQILTSHALSWRFFVTQYVLR